MKKQTRLATSASLDSGIFFDGSVSIHAIPLEKKMFRHSLQQAQRLSYSSEQDEYKLINKYGIDMIKFFSSFQTEKPLKLKQKNRNRRKLES